MENGKFIVFEGLDGTGKSTQLSLLAQALRQMGHTVFTDAEPSSLPTGRFLRRRLAGEFSGSPWADAALFLADRINQNVDPENGILKHLRQGDAVILDRYYYSTFAYQGCGTDMDWAMDMHFGCPEIARPDLTLFLTMEPEKCIARIRANRKAEELEIFETVETLSAVADQFGRVFDALRDQDNIVYINADGTIQQVHERILSAVLPLFGKE